MENELVEITIPFPSKDKKEASNLKIGDSDSREERTIVEESSMLMDAASIFLDSCEHKVTEIKSASEESSMTGQMQSEMLKDLGKRVHEEDLRSEQNSITNNKKRRRSKKGAKNETESVVLPDGVEIDDNTCPRCLKRFDVIAKKKKHMRQVHKIVFRRKSNIKCNECNIEFLITNKLRKHLSQVHNLRMTEEDFSFSNIEAFKVWKLNLERKEGVFFITQQAGQKTKTLGKRYNYVCNRSGTYKPQIKGPKRQRKINYRGSCKMGSYCTAAISCFVIKDEVQVKYWPQHYGHAKDISSELPLGKDQSTLEGEIITEYDAFNDLLKDVRSNLTSESILPTATRKRDKQILTEAFESDEYNSGLTDSESVDHWVQLCLQMEDSPVLCYRQEELADGEEFLLVIMTEFQKQLLMSSEKKVICVDCVHRRKGGRFYLTCISIVDECDVALPVAFCISNKVDENVIKQFLMSVKKSTGPLSCTYFMSDSENFYFDAWREIMNDTSKWLWSMWYMDYKLTIKLRNLFSSCLEKKVEIYRTIKTLIECHSQTIFESTFKKFLDSLLIDQLLPVKKFGDVLSNKYSPNVERWAYCYRTDLKTSTSFQLDALHRTLRFCCVEGRKTRLDKFIFVLMKFVKRKMLDRLRNILDDEKTIMVKETINMCHKAGLDISPQDISSLSDKIWLIKSEGEENVYVVRDFDSCPEHCMMRCTECDICVHMFSCSCIPSMINANLCHHIHAVVWKFLTPHHFSPMPSPALDNNADSDSNDTTAPRNNCSEILDSVLNMAHEIYKSVRENKGKLSNEALTLIKWKLSDAKECIDVYSGKKATSNTAEIIQKVPILPNSDSLPILSQDSIVQPIVLQALQNPNVKVNSSQTLVADQVHLGLPHDKSLSQQYVIYLPHTK